MANFDVSFKKVLLDEGGYVNDPNDTGGETYLGISRVHNPKAKMWNLIDTVKREHGLSDIDNRLKAIPAIVEDAKFIYKRNYWDVIGLDALNSDKLAHQIFDMAVNAGVSLAIKLAEELVGLPKTGTLTLALRNKLREYGKS